MDVLAYRFAIAIYRVFLISLKRAVKARSAFLISPNVMIFGR